MKANINFKNIKKKTPKPSLSTIIPTEKEEKTRLLEPLCRQKIVIVGDEITYGSAAFFIMGGMLFGFALHMCVL